MVFYLERDIVKINEIIKILERYPNLELGIDLCEGEKIKKYTLKEITAGSDGVRLVLEFTKKLRRG